MHTQTHTVSHAFINKFFKYLGNKYHQFCINSQKIEEGAPL